MSLEIEGKIIRKLNVQTGVSQRGNWSKQEFIIEYQEGSYPSQACFSVWGEDKVKDLERFQIGDSVKLTRPGVRLRPLLLRQQLQFRRQGIPKPLHRQQPTTVRMMTFRSDRRICTERFSQE